MLFIGSDGICFSFVNILKRDKIIILFNLIIFIESDLCDISVGRQIDGEFLFFNFFLETLVDILTFRGLRQLLLGH